MRPEGCICGWVQVHPLVPVMTARRPSCPVHGNATEWWANIQKHARSLGGHAGRQDGGSDG